MDNNVFMMSLLLGIALLPANLFSTLAGLLIFTEVPLFMILVRMDPLPTSLFSAPMGLPHNYIII